MSSRKLLVLTGVVVALFAFIFFFERKMPTTAERQQKGDLHWDLPEDRVERIRLERGGETLELAKSGDSWKLERPEAYPADSFAAGELASELADLKNPGGEPPADVAGPVSLAVAAGGSEAGKPPARKGRLVVVGNSRFAAAGSLGSAGNANLFLNSIHWLTGSEKRIGIAPKTPEQASLSLTQAQVRRITLLAILGMPAMAVLLGIWVWYRRRD